MGEIVLNTVLGAGVGVNYVLALIDSVTSHYGPCNLKLLNFNPQFPRTSDV